MLNEEDRADQFYSAREYMVRQGELVTYLLSMFHPVLAHGAVQSVLEFLRAWDDRPWDQVQLQLAYQDSRWDTERRYEACT